MEKVICRLICALSLLATGCQSTIWVSENNENKGIPFKTAQAYIMTGIYKRHTINGTKCTDNPFVQNLSLPTGATHYINVKNGPFASSEFNLTTHSSGTLSSVGLNSTPAINETIDSLAGVATDVIFPLLGVGATDNGGASTGTASFSSPASASDLTPACDTGPTGIHVVPLEDVLAGSRAARTVETP